MDFLNNIVDKEFFSVLLTWTEYFFVVYLAGYTTFLFVSMVVGSNHMFADIKKRQLHNQVKHDYYVPVSIIVPAYNEEVTIEATIRSLLSLDYRIYEIIVVSDGSKDRTGEIVAERFGLHPVKRPIRRQVPCKNALSVYEGTGGNHVPIILINKENGGKADAINMGINASHYPYFVCMDADSILQRDSLSKIATPVLENQNVVAVGSMIRISNDSEFRDGKLVKFRLPKKLVPALQVLEYERSFLASRVLLDKFNANLIISGAFGLFKKDSVINIGGYAVGSMGEDMELITRLHSYYRANRLPYQIKYAYDAVCWTQAPERLRDLMRQRKRWHTGLIESLTRHTRLFSFGSYIYYLLYELLSPLIALYGLFVTALAFALGMGNVKTMVVLYVVYALFGSFLTLISFLTRSFLSTDAHISLKDALRAFLLCIPENMFVRIVMEWVRLRATLTFHRKKSNWGRIERKQINYSSSDTNPPA